MKEVCLLASLLAPANQPNTLDYIAALEKALGRKADMEMLPLQLGDVPDTYADVTDLASEFGYKPATPVEQGVASFVAWYRNFFKA